MENGRRLADQLAWRPEVRERQCPSQNPAATLCWASVRARLLSEPTSPCTLSKGPRPQRWMLACSAQHPARHVLPMNPHRPSARSPYAAPPRAQRNCTKSYAMVLVNVCLFSNLFPCSTRGTHRCGPTQARRIAFPFGRWVLRKGGTHCPKGAKHERQI